MKSQLKIAQTTKDLCNLKVHCLGYAGFRACLIQQFNSEIEALDSFLYVSTLSSGCVPYVVSK